jgi:hypothetical protein
MLDKSKFSLESGSARINLCFTLYNVDETAEYFGMAFPMSMGLALCSSLSRSILRT